MRLTINEPVPLNTQTSRCPLHSRYYKIINLDTEYDACILSINKNIVVIKIYVFPKRSMKKIAKDRVD